MVERKGKNMVKKIKKVAVLGAGYMGSAITFPISDNGISVSLWGTWLDNDIISNCKKGKSHPKLKKKLNSNVVPFYSDEIGEAVKNADTIIIAVSSEGFVPVYEKLLEVIHEDTTILTLTKGLVNVNNDVFRISEYATLRYKKTFNTDDFRLWGSVGGPVKAVELSNKIPTATIIGSKDNKVYNIFKSFETEYYRISYTEDSTGVEICSALKNVYAIAGGICDGLYAESIPDQYHNFKSALFMQSIEEMAFVSRLVGGNRETAYGLAGTGDLYVTVSSGRNSLYGRRIGKGENAETAYHEMLEEDKLAEGYNTLRIARNFLYSYSNDIPFKMPLFDTLYKIVFNDKKYLNQLEDLMKKLNIKKIK